jgi:hypothetical protein
MRDGATQLPMNLNTSYMLHSSKLLSNDFMNFFELHVENCPSLDSFELSPLSKIEGKVCELASPHLIVVILSRGRQRIVESEMTGRFAFSSFNTVSCFFDDNMKS